MILGFWFLLFFDGDGNSSSKEGLVVLVELGVVEQRYQAVFADVLLAPSYEP